MVTSLTRRLPRKPPASILSPTSASRFMIICCRSLGCASCWPMMPAPGKPLCPGLYIREMLARRLIRRVLIVPPAGLVGNWERELRTLFGLHFQIVTGSDARNGNPFTGPDSNLVIVSIDTLAGDRAFARLTRAGGRALRSGDFR